jgi:hypothetical protein
MGFEVSRSVQKYTHGYFPKVTKLEVQISKGIIAT